MPSDERTPPEHGLDEAALDEDPLGGPRNVPADAPPTVSEGRSELEDEPDATAPKSTMPSARPPGAAP